MEYFTQAQATGSFSLSGSGSAFRSLAIFLSLRFRKIAHNRWLFPSLRFLWAVIVCYSRPYLGKHYPGDVVCGALLGLCIGTLVFFIIQYIEKLVNKYRRVSIHTVL